MKTKLKRKRVLVTGACGTIGRELVKLLLQEYNVEELVGIDNNESELFFLEQEFSRFDNTHFFLADVRDLEKIKRVMKHIQVVFHAAAFKHVFLCEKSPYEAVQTNIIGVHNVVSAAGENKVEKVIFTSSDKAVNPTNVMGTSKLMGERMITAANSKLRESGPVFASVRFGNVLGSRGSVIPIFREQIKKGGPVTLTDEKMTRFIMSIENAVRLVIDAMFLAQGGDVFITKMPIIRIKDLAEVMIDELAPTYGYRPDDISIKMIGAKPGEKMYEELMNEEETRRARELDKYFVLLPAFTNMYREISYDYDDYISMQVEKPYNSSNGKPMCKKELFHFLGENNLLYESASNYRHPDKRHWP